MKRKVICWLFGILLLSLVCASFELGDSVHDIDASYGPNSDLRGWVNISFNNTPATNLLTDIFGNSISLKDLVKVNEQSDDYFYEHSCIPSDCETGYTSYGGEEEKTVNFIDEEVETVGFKLQGVISNIESVNFSIESNASISCFSQIKIDFFKDGVVDKINTKMSNLNCDSLRRIGCFNSSKVAKEPEITRVPSCQRITLSESPGFRLGAWIKAITPGDKEIRMELYDIDKGAFAEGALCYIDTDNLLPGGGEAYCEIEFPVGKEKDYYVCVHSDEGTGEYFLKGYADSEGCGFNKVPTPWETENAAYGIFAEGMKFSAPGNLTIRNEDGEGGNLANLFSTYIQEKYGGLENCADGCIVPMEIYSSQPQRIVLRDLIIKYSEEVGSPTERNFYDLNEVAARLSGNMQKLYFNLGNFTLPGSFGEKDYWIKLNGSELVSDSITIETIPVILGLSPTLTFSAFPTPFEVRVANSSKKVASYFWVFGDGKEETTSGPNVIHIYNSTGTYKLKVTVTDEAGKSSYREVDIVVGLPEEVINSTLVELETDLSKILNQISNFSEFERKQLTALLETDDKNSELKQLRRDYTAAKSTGTEAEFNSIMTSLLEMGIPKSITEIESADQVSFIPIKENIDLGSLSSATEEGYDSDKAGQYKDAMITWINENLEMKVSLRKFSAKYGEANEHLMSFVKISINEKGSLNTDPYLLIEKLEGLDFKEDYREEETTGHHYIELRTMPQTILFSTTEEVEFTDMPAFVSPEIKKLSILEEDGTVKEGGDTNWLLVVLVVFLVLIIGLIVYIFLQEWYKKNYEDYLFKDKNALYNLITYVQNATKKGLPHGEMKKRLGTARWSREQVNYVMRKYAGKRTGMWEIPVKKILDKVGRKKVRGFHHGQRFRR